jgi:hypothetical protein
MTVREIRSAFREMEDLFSAAAAVRSSNTIGWRREAIDVRRRLAAKLSEVSAMLSAVQPSSPATQAYEACRRALADLRDRLATHQANWPMVAIDLASNDYRASQQRVWNAFRALEKALSGIEATR